MSGLGFEDAYSNRPDNKDKLWSSSTQERLTVDKAEHMTQLNPSCMNRPMNLLMFVCSFLIHFHFSGRTTPFEASSLKLLYAASHLVQYKLFVTKISTKSLQKISTLTKKVLPKKVEKHTL